MNHKKIACFILLLTLPCCVNAKVIEVSELASVFSSVDKNTLLVFDLDNTIIMPAQTLGGEEWYDYLVEKYRQEYADQKEPEAETKAIDRAVLDWNAVHETTAVVPVKEEIPPLIARQQEKGAITVGLTARSLELSGATRRQLLSVGIDFNKAAALQKSPALQELKDNGEFDNGVLFAGKNTKGEVLLEFLRITKLQPGKIIFVDNKRHHLENVEKALADMPTDYTGCRYGATDAKIAAFNKDIAAVQYRYFKKILSDKAAEILLQNGIQ